ncbi:MAG TPA: S-layer homology domain-containing protein [Candidatus Peribacteraceae bacterium]|nr:S-layer homology domain-containing protein [Candidatus Peribacteraceae bacterium]
MKHSILSTATALLVAFPLMANAMGIQVIVDGKTVTFNDVPQTAWYATYVHDAAQAGIVNGYKDAYGNFTGRFGPGNQVTVAEALKIAIEGAGYDTQNYSTVIDSGTNGWFAPYVSVAKGEHFAIVGSAINYNRAATRAEVASIFTSAFHVNIDAQASTNYSDVNAQTSYAPSISALTRDKIVSGDTDANGNLTNMFRPDDSVARAEMVKMVLLARAQYGEVGQGRGTSSETTSQGQTTVTYTNSGFSPSILHVKVGTTVTFKNLSNNSMWIAGSSYPGLDSQQGYATGEIYAFTFNRVGTWSYENRLHASDTATIVVDQ